LGLGCWSLGRLWTVLGLRHGLLRGWTVLGLRLGLNRAILRLLLAELRLLLPRLRLDWTRLLRLGFRLLRLNGANLLRRGRPIVGLYGSHLWLAGAGPIVRLNRPDLGLDGSNLGLARTAFGLTGSYFRLAWAGFRLPGPNWLYLRPVVWFRTKPRLGRSGLGLSRANFLSRTNFRLAGAISRSGAGEARLRGDRPGGCDDGWAASVDVVELLAVLCCFALVLDLS
jgi:hypothetical protein